jgi:Icc protein
MHKHITLKQRHSDHVELIQLTDTHIFSSEGKDFDGINTLDSLKQVITHVQGQHWPPDAILMTGDLVHEPLTVAYQRLLAVLQELQIPIVCLAGNHDVPDLMQEILHTENISTAKSIFFNNWHILMLNTFLANTHSGNLAPEELQFLEQQLQSNPDKFTLVCLHHPPVKIDSPWMDAMGLKNPEDLFSIIDDHTHIKGILWGHIHQEFMLTRNGMLLMATPSTCVQFKPNTEEYEKDNKSAGYRRLRLLASGEISTKVHRIQKPTLKM